MLEICLLNSFDTQIQFVERVRTYLANTNVVSSPLKKDYSLLLIQVELNQRYDNDLLACVRHLIVETIKELNLTGNVNRVALIGLIVMVPRENVRNVSGFQFGLWCLNSAKISLGCLNYFI